MPNMIERFSIERKEQKADQKVVSETNQIQRAWEVGTFKILRSFIKTQKTFSADVEFKKKDLVLVIKV